MFFQKFDFFKIAYNQICPFLLFSRSRHPCFFQVFLSSISISVNLSHVIGKRQQMCDHQLEKHKKVIFFANKRGRKNMTTIEQKCYTIDHGKSDKLGSGAELEKIACFKILESSSLYFQNDLAFLGRIGKPSLSEFPEIYGYTVCLMDLDKLITSYQT